MNGDSQKQFRRFPESIVRAFFLPRPLMQVRNEGVPTDKGGFRGVYIHVPFCEAKCGYCSFYSVRKDRRYQKRPNGRRDHNARRKAEKQSIRFVGYIFLEEKHQCRAERSGDKDDRKSDDRKSRVAHIFYFLWANHGIQRFTFLQYSSYSFPYRSFSHFSSVCFINTVKNSQ